MSRIPPVYRDWGGPLRYQDDVSRELPTAVLAYFESRATSAQLELVRDYCEYYINAPCWDSNPHLDDESRAELAGLRSEVKTAVTANALQAWIYKCIDIGIDPL